MRPLHVLRMLQSGRALSWHKFTLSSHDQFQDNFSSMSTFRARWTLSCSCFYVIFSAGCSTCWLYSQSIKMPWWCHLAGTIQLQRLGRGESCHVPKAPLIFFMSLCHFEAILFQSFTLVAAWNSAATQDNFYTFQEIWV